jgi:AcrR family transcriptional regulator
MVTQTHVETAQARRPSLQERKAMTRAAIIDAAGELFRSQGVDETSMAQIARRADTGVGTLYGYFPSKDDLLREILLSLTRSATDRYQSTVSESTPHIDRLLTGLNVFAEFLEENRIIMRSAFMAGNRHEIVSEFAEPMFTAYCRMVNEGIEAGEFAPLPVESTIKVLLTTYTMAFLGLGAWSGQGESGSTREDLATIVRNMLKRP